MVVATTDIAESVRVRVEPRGTLVTAAAGSVLLDVLRGAGVPVSYSCQAGRCGTCRCDLIEGDVLEDADREFRGGPVPSETRQVLACRTKLLTDCVIGLVEPDETIVHAAQTLKCRVEAIERLNASTIALRLRPNRPLRFSAGQFAKLDFGAGLARSYSMANDEDAALLEFHVRRVPGGRVTHFIAEQLRTGHIVKLMGPLGTSYLRRKHSGPTLLVAGGTGLAPIGAIARTALAKTSQGPLHLYVGARAEPDLYGIEALRELAHEHASRLILHVGVDQQPRDTSVRHGLITDLVREDFASLAHWKVYLAGPPQMVEAGARLASRLGARSADIHADAFYPSDN